jgi:hypothetical protein
MVAGNMRPDSVFTEDMDNEKAGEFGRRDVVRSRNKDALFGKSVNDYKECRVSVRVRKVFDEVDGNGIPGSLGDRELLQKSVGFMTRGFRSFASGTGTAKVLNEGAEIRPNIVAADRFESLVLPEVSCENMIMFVLQNLESEVRNVRYENPIVIPK